MVDGEAGRSRQFLVIDGNRYELPQRLDEEYELQGVFGAGNFGQISTCETAFCSFDCRSRVS